MQRITLRDLEGVVKRINRTTKSPEAPYTRGADGKFRANIGNYHLDGAYGGYALHQMQNEGGGVRDVLRIGHVSKRGLYDAMHAFVAGLDTAAEMEATK